MQQKRHFVATKNGKCCPKGAQAGWRGGALPKRIKSLGHEVVLNA